MNAVGIFAGRGDVIVALGLALLVGAWVGWKIHQLYNFLKRKSGK
jgi:hypothetical protein